MRDHDHPFSQVLARINHSISQVFLSFAQNTSQFQYQNQNIHGKCSKEMTSIEWNLYLVTGNLNEYSVLCLVICYITSKLKMKFDELPGCFCTTNMLIRLERKANNANKTMKTGGCEQIDLITVY